MRLPTFTAKASLAKPSRFYGTWARDVLHTDFSTAGAEPADMVIDTESGLPAEEGGVEENGYEDALELEETGSEETSDAAVIEADAESAGIEETVDADETEETD
jgi:hypothetical protein